jgi:hypothetical protein
MAAFHEITECSTLDLFGAHNGREQGLQLTFVFVFVSFAWPHGS